MFYIPLMSLTREANKDSEKPFLLQYYRIAGCTAFLRTVQSAQDSQDREGNGASSVPVPTTGTDFSVLHQHACYLCAIVPWMHLGEPSDNNTPHPHCSLPGGGGLDSVLVESRMRVAARCGVQTTEERTALGPEPFQSSPVLLSPRPSRDNHRRVAF
jgi:hypothetical protein